MNNTSLNEGDNQIHFILKTVDHVAVSTTTPSTYETPLGKSCDEYSATNSEAVQTPASMSEFELEEGLPYKFQLFLHYLALHH